MATNIKQQILVVILIVLMGLLSILFVHCATLEGWLGQSQLQTYTFNYDGKDYSALLPKEIPVPSETAPHMPQCFFMVCVLHIQYQAGEQPHPNLPVVSFWFTEKLGVIGVVWHSLKKDDTIKHEGWLYVKGLPIATTVEAFDEMLDGLLSESDSTIKWDTINGLIL